MFKVISFCGQAKKVFKGWGVDTTWGALGLLPYFCRSWLQMQVWWLQCYLYGKTKRRFKVQISKHIGISHLICLQIWTLKRHLVLPYR